MTYTYITPKVMRILKYLRVSPVVSGEQSQFSFRHIRASIPRTFAIVKFYNREFTSIAAKYCLIDVSTCLLLKAFDLSIVFYFATFSAPFHRLYHS